MFQFKSPAPPKNNQFLWLRIPTMLLAIVAWAFLAAHFWANAQARLPMADLTTLGLVALAWPAVIIEVLAYQVYVDRYTHYVDEFDAVHKWRSWRKEEEQEEEDDIVH